MDLDRMTPAARLSLCRKYFFFGIACLPFLWLVNSIWFGNFVFIKKGETAKDRARRLGAAIGGDSDASDQASTSAAAPIRVAQPSTSGASSSRHRHHAVNTAESPESTPPDPESEEEKRRSLEGIRRYVLMSAIGALIWAVGIITWVVIYQVNRAAWGEFGDKISFNIPRGIP